MWGAPTRLSTLDPISGVLAQCYVLFTGHLLQRRGGADVASAYTDNRLGEKKGRHNSRDTLRLTCRHVLPRVWGGFLHHCSGFSSVQLRPWGLQFWDTLQLRGDNNWEICYVLEFGNILALILQWITPLKSHEIFIVSLIYVYIYMFNLNGCCCEISGLDCKPESTSTFYLAPWSMPKKLL